MDYDKLIKDLRACSGDRKCEGCSRNYTIDSNSEKPIHGCDLLESDAADAIEVLQQKLS